MTNSIIIIAMEIYWLKESGPKIHLIESPLKNSIKKRKTEYTAKYIFSKFLHLSFRYIKNSVIKRTNSNIDSTICVGKHDLIFCSAYVYVIDKKSKYSIPKQQPENKQPILPNP